MVIQEIEKIYPHYTFFFFLNNTSFYLAVRLLHLTEHDFYDLHTDVHDWRVTVMKWLFIPFS